MFLFTEEVQNLEFHYCPKSCARVTSSQLGWSGFVAVYFKYLCTVHCTPGTKAARKCFYGVDVAGGIMMGLQPLDPHTLARFNQW